MPPKRLQELFRLAKHSEIRKPCYQNKASCCSFQWMAEILTHGSSEKFPRPCMREKSPQPCMREVTALPGWKPLWHMWRQVKQIRYSPGSSTSRGALSKFPNLPRPLFPHLSNGGGGQSTCPASHTLPGPHGHPGPPQPPSPSGNLLYSDYVNDTPISSTRKTTPCPSEYSGLFGRGLCVIN